MVKLSKMRHRIINDAYDITFYLQLNFNIITYNHIRTCLLLDVYYNTIFILSSILISSHFSLVSHIRIAFK